MCRDLVRIMVQVGMERTNPGFLIAPGWAADAALRAVLAEPRLLRGVVVISPELPGHQESPERRTLWSDMRAAVAAENVAAAFERYRRDARFDGLRDRPEIFSSVHAMHARCGGAALLVVETSPQVVAQLSTAKVPILALAGALDREEFRATARDIARTAPNSVWQEVEASGHFPNLERPAAFEAQLREFMTRLEATS
jgi:pimeloyl-ACP methyl ester carboxylesterase